MTIAKTMNLGLLLAVLATTGCGQPPNTPKTDAPKASTQKPTAHSHGAGPNGGVVFDLGKYHAEFTVNHSAKQCTVLFVTGDASDAKPMPVMATGFTLSTKETKTADGTVVPPMTVKLLPKDAKDGKASTFVGTDPGIGNAANFQGTVVGEIDGKPSQGEFKE